MTAAVQASPNASTWPALLRVGATILLLSAQLGGCGLVRDDIASNVMVTPGKYWRHNCQLLAGTLAGTRQNLDALEKLTARASQGPGGAAIGAAAYRTEYLAARGEEKELLAAMAEKNCKTESSWTSDRTVY